MGPFLFCDLVDYDLYERFLLMSYATKLLLTSRQYANDAEKLIALFLKKTEDRCGQEVFTTNMHSLSHLTWQVKMWRHYGPLWSSSAIMFDSANHLPKTTFTGTVNHLRLLVERYLRNKTERDKVPDNDLLKDLCLSMRNEKKCESEKIRTVQGSSVKIFSIIWGSRCSTSKFAIRKKKTHLFLFFRRSIEIRIDQFYSMSGSNFARIVLFNVIKSFKPQQSRVDFYSYVEVKPSCETLCVM